MPAPMTVSIYNIETGEILQTLQGELSDIINDFKQGVEGLVDGEWNSDLYYVVSGEVKKRPRMDIKPNLDMWADDQHVLVIENVPKGTEVRFSDERHVIDDGVFEYSTGFAGDVHFTFQPPWPAQRQKVFVRAHPPQQQENN